MESNFMRLMMFFGALFLGVFVGLVLMALLGMALHVPVTELQSLVNQTGTAAERTTTKIFLLINHLSFFILPSVFFAWFAQRWDYQDYFSLRRWPKRKSIGLGVLFVLVAYPFVQKSYDINNMLPIPQWMLEMEKAATETIRQLLIMEHAGEFLLNILVIGILPGIGEELLFRGVIQKEFERWFRNPHVGVWLAAILFSAMHFQFVGFLPRMFLGALLGYLYVFTRNLFVPMLVHFINNVLPVISLYLAGKDLTELGTDPSASSPWWLAILSFVLTLALGYYIYSLHKSPADESVPHVEDPQP